MGKPCSLPHRLVCGKPFHTDFDHPCESHKQDPFYSKPCEQCFALYFTGDCGRWHLSALFTCGRGVRLGAVASKVLVPIGRDGGMLCPDYTDR